MPPLADYRTAHGFDWPTAYQKDLKRQRQRQQMSLASAQIAGWTVRSPRATPKLLKRSARRVFRRVILRWGPGKIVKEEGRVAAERGTTSGGTHATIRTMLKEWEADWGRPLPAIAAGRPRKTPLV